MLTLQDARPWYPQDDEVHGFGHIERVYRLCQKIGELEGADMEILLTAALLHDAQGSHPGENSRDDHHLRSAEFAGEILSGMGWDNERIEAVQHCIRAHRYRKEDIPESLEAKVLFDADKLDVLGAVGVVRALAYAFQVETPAYAKPSEHFLTHWETLEGEPHSAYHEYLFKLKNIASRLLTPTARVIASERQTFLNRFFEQLAEEMREDE
jgi:uncharacterized protein